MKGKLYGNGLWESSRMMLPEHKEAILQKNRNMERRKRAILDEQEIERISRVLATSLQAGTTIRLRIFGEWEEREIHGTVTGTASGGGQVRLQTACGCEWISLQDIVVAEELE